MTISRSTGMLIACAAALLTACTTAVPQSGFSPAAPARQPMRITAWGSDVPLHPDRRRSWMLRGAASGDLLYVSDSRNRDVRVYTYPRGKLVGTLTGFASPEGMCVDKTGDVWITDRTGFDVIEYAHGGTNPIATLNLPNEVTEDCSVDPTTGNLAVVNYCKVNQPPNCVNSPGSVAIYQQAKGYPTFYKNPPMATMFYGAFDDRGNFFVDGQSYVDNFEFAELPNGSDKFTTFILDRVIYFPGGIQWDGKHVVLGDQEAGNKITSSIHQIQTNGNRASVIGTTPLGGAGEVSAFWLQGSTIIGPNLRLGSPSDTRFWNYPAGGKPTKVIKGGLASPTGAVVSPKQ